MSWIVSNNLNWFQKLCINVLKCGPVPQHVAFIMDGNRRYAKKAHIDRKDGHVKGFDKLAETLQWCLELGIREVTVYAFSIENFKRSSEEVETLMELAREKYKRLLDEKDQLMENGVCIRVIGKLDLLPPDLRKSMAEAVISTKDNKRLFLNVAFAYTSREEITTAISTVVDGVNSGKIDVDDIDKELLSHCLYTNHSKNPEILVRTSGEARLSDFLLWQINNASICFTKVLWPEFCIWHLLAAVFYYQRSYAALRLPEITEMSRKQQEFLLNVDAERMNILEEYAKA